MAVESFEELGRIVETATAITEENRQRLAQVDNPQMIALSRGHRQVTFMVNAVRMYAKEPQRFSEEQSSIVKQVQVFHPELAEEMGKLTDKHTGPVQKLAAVFKIIRAMRVRTQREEKKVEENEEYTLNKSVLRSFPLRDLYAAFIVEDKSTEGALQNGEQEDERNAVEELLTRTQAVWGHIVASGTLDGFPAKELESRMEGVGAGEAMLIHHSVVDFVLNYAEVIRLESLLKLLERVPENEKDVRVFVDTLRRYLNLAVALNDKELLNRLRADALIQNILHHEEKVQWLKMILQKLENDDGRWTYLRERYYPSLKNLARHCLKQFRDKMLHEFFMRAIAFEENREKHIEEVRKVVARVEDARYIIELEHRVLSETGHVLLHRREELSALILEEITAILLALKRIIKSFRNKQIAEQEKVIRLVREYKREVEQKWSDALAEFHGREEKIIIGLKEMIRQHDGVYKKVDVDEMKEIVMKGLQRRAELLQDLRASAAHIPPDAPFWRNSTHRLLLRGTATQALMDNDYDKMVLNVENRLPTDDERELLAQDARTMLRGAELSRNLTVQFLHEQGIGDVNQNGQNGLAATTGDGTSTVVVNGGGGAPFSSTDTSGQPSQQVTVQGPSQGPQFGQERGQSQSPTAQQNQQFSQRETAARPGQIAQDGQVVRRRSFRRARGMNINVTQGQGGRT